MLSNENFKPIESGYILSSGTKIYYESYGKGIPLIMLHGNGQDSSFFINQLAFFKDYFYVILVDSRGHGESDFGKKKLSLNILTEDIQKVIDELHISQTLILGFSDGGNIAIKLAERIPDKIMAIITVSPNLNSEGLKMWFRVSVQMSYMFFNKLSMIEWFNKKAQLLSLIIHESTTTKDKLASLYMPVLIIAGEYDIIHSKHMRAMSNLIPNSKLTIINKSGHNLLITHSDIVNIEIYNFIKPFNDKVSNQIYGKNLYPHIENDSEKSFLKSNENEFMNILYFIF